MKKILRIIARLNTGGPAQNVVFLSEGLNGGAFETLLAIGRITEDEGDMSFLLKGRDIRYIIIPEMTRRLNLFKDIISLYKIFNLVRKEKPDIIHTHTAKAGALGRVAGLLWRLGKSASAPKLVHTFHGHIMEGYFGWFKTSIFLMIERFLARFTDRIVAVSESVKQDLLKLRIGTEEKIVVIPLGLELERFLAQKSEVRSQKSEVKIGIVGRLVPIKNHKMFLDVAKKILSEHRIPSTEYQFLIIGDGERRNGVEEYAKELGIAGNVVFTGWQYDLIKMYQEIDIVCLTSLNEGTPVSLIEAMAYGRPVVATCVGGVRDIVTSHRSQVTSYMVCERGILVKPGDVESFAEAVKILLENASLRDKIAEDARRFVRENFSKTRLIRDMEGLYLRLWQKS